MSQPPDVTIARSGDDPEGPRRPPPATVFVLALVVVVAVGVLGFVFGRSTVDPLTTGELVPLATTTSTTGPVTTTTEPPSTMTGPLLEWQQVATLDIPRVTALVEFQGRQMVFGPEKDSDRDPGGLKAFESADGLTWSQLGVVIAAPAEVNAVVSSGDRLLAVGSIPIATEAGSVVRPAAWMTSDGRAWTAIDLPLPSDTSEVISGSAFTGGLVGSIALVAGQTYVDLARIIEQALPEEIRALLDEDELDWRLDRGTVIVYGPFGVRLSEVTADDLGLDQQALNDYWSGDRSSQVVWVSQDLRTFEAREDEPFGPDAWIDQMLAVPKDGLIAFGWGDMGRMTWLSEDGEAWEGQRSRREISRASGWGEDLVAEAPGRRQPTIVRSPDGVEWTETSPPEMFPGDLHWHFRSVSAGAYGVAAAAFGSDDVDQSRPAPVTISKDGVMVTFDDWEGQVTVEDAEGNVIVYPLWDEEGAGMSGDLVSGTIVFADPDSNRPIVELTFDEAIRLQQSAYEGFGSEDNLFAVIYSRDGSEWSLQPLDEIFGSSRTSVRIGRGATTDIAVAVSETGVLAALTYEFAPQVVDLWLGVIP